MANIENRWTIGNVVQLVGLGATIVSLGIAVGSFNVRMDRLEETARQSASDSRTLIELRTDVAYIKRMVMSGAVSVSSNISCPDSQPVLVASYCRAAPVSSSSPDR